MLCRHCLQIYKQIYIYICKQCRQTSQLSRTSQNAGEIYFSSLTCVCAGARARGGGVQLTENYNLYQVKTSIDKEIGAFSGRHHASQVPMDVRVHGLKVYCLRLGGVMFIVGISGLCRRECGCRVGRSGSVRNQTKPAIASLETM
jgi:hypothetical protein